MTTSTKESTMPSEITTAAELDALPVGSVWTDAYDNIGFRQEPGYLVPTGTWLDSLDKRSPTKWLTAAEIIAETARYGALPLTVLYRPDRPAQPTVQPSVESVARAIRQAGDQRNNNSALIAESVRQAQAVLALIGGRTEAEVKAEALEEAATSLEGGLGVEGTPGTLYEYRAWLRARAAAIRGEQ